jgi:hypothetical protein
MAAKNGCVSMPNNYQMIYAPNVYTNLDVSSISLGHDLALILHSLKVHHQSISADTRVNITIWPTTTVVLLTV